MLLNDIARSSLSLLSSWYPNEKISEKKNIYLIKKITRKEGYPISDEIMKNGILLPLHHGMTVDMFNRLHNCIEEFLADKL